MNNANKRIEYLDVAKGVGIILVVWAHASGPFSNYINQFHMPLFFLISGFLYNSRLSVIEYVKNKVIHLYIPFVFWNLLGFIGTSVLTYIENTWGGVYKIF